MNEYRRCLRCDMDIDPAVYGDQREHGTDLCNCISVLRKELSRLRAIKAAAKEIRLFLGDNAMQRLGSDPVVKYLGFGTCAVHGDVRVVSINDRGVYCARCASRWTGEAPYGFHVAVAVAVEPKEVNG